MNQRRIQPSRLEPAASWRPSRQHVASTLPCYTLPCYILVCCTLACTPLRDLSSYSSAASSSGSSGRAPAAVIDTEDEPAPLEDGQGGAPARPDVPDATASAPAPGAGEGDSFDAGEPSPSPACDGAGEALAADGGCFLVVAEAISWDAASAACADWGGALARIDSAEREAALSTLAAADIWIGLNDRETEGAMLWDGGGALGAYRHWATDQPDDFDGSEDCVELLADGRGYNDRPCTDARPYVCERL